MTTIADSLTSEQRRAAYQAAHYTERRRTAPIRLLRRHGVKSVHFYCRDGGTAPAIRCTLAGLGPNELREAVKALQRGARIKTDGTLVVAREG